MSISRVRYDTINPLVKAAEYAVRGPIVARSAELAQQLKDGKELPFKRIIPCNIGNPHALHQKSISFLRNVLSLVINPELQKHTSIFKPDVIARASKYLSVISSAGAYSESQVHFCLKVLWASFIYLLLVR